MDLHDPGATRTSAATGSARAIFDEVLEPLPRLTCARGASARVGLDATPAGRGIYAQRGFVDGAALVRMRARAGRAARLRRGPVATCSSRAPTSSTVLERATAQVFGADRRAVLRVARRPRPPDLARVVRDGERVEGLLLRPARGPRRPRRPGRRRGRGARARARARVLAARRGAARSSWTRARDRAGSTGLRGLGFREQRPLHAHVPRRRATGAPRPELEPAILGPEFG